MSIILPKDTRVLVQGITGLQGRFHTKKMLEYGTNIVAGVTPGKGKEVVEGIEVFNSVSEAMSKKPNAAIIFVPAQFARDAALESLENNLKIIVIITEHIPVHDTIEILEYAKLKKAVVIGPNTPGIILPHTRTKLGIMPNEIFLPGNIGVVSRSGTLTYEIVEVITKAGFGVSACIGLGGDAVVGMSFVDVLKIFEKDKKVEKIVLIGEIGGSAEEEACSYIAKMKKPVYAYIAGITAPKGKRMGHAGAIIARGKGSAESKIKSFEGVGVTIAKLPSEIGKLIAE
ncbi:MAG: succinate--CoA ligase subunit alpha [Candidatus Thermoplasmatota archaeon]|nr:succinate--CoA ligase subunit alpha [Candidatus Thermoplasmatota archaeon]MDI6856195.1 succinate--CoA ligase subunit alpha [Candidatus Thermoplasmatota archaeon]